MNLEPQSVKLQRSWQHEAQLTCCRFSPDGASLIAAGHEGRLHRYSLDGDDHESFEAHRGWVEAITWTPDQSHLLTADSWGQVCCWRWADGRLQSLPVWSIASACASWLRDLAVSPDGRWLATCGNEPVVRIFSTQDGKLAHELHGHEHVVMSVAFSPDGKGVVSGDLHGVVRDWDLADGSCRRQLAASQLFKTYYHYQQGGVRVMAFDAPGKTLYCAGFEGTNANQAQGNPLVLAFDWETGQQKSTLTPAETINGPITDLAFHPAGFLVAAGSSEGGGVLWFWRPGEVKSFHSVKHKTSLRRFDVASDGLRLAAATFGSETGQRGGNGRKLKDGEYIDFGGSLVLYQWT